MIDLALDRECDLIGGRLVGSGAGAAVSPVAAAAVASNPRALKYLSPAARSDRRLCTAACAKDGHALQYCSEALRADREVVEAAVRQNRAALKWCE